MNKNYFVPNLINRPTATDIKPPNVGFDRDGTLKLFDFGLAKELPADCSAYSSSATTFNKLKTFQTLGNTGTTRYMAPEVIRREPYNCKVDVFATSIVTWEIMTLRKPYGADVSGQFVKECVAIYDDRPPIPSSPAIGRRTSKCGATVWPKSLKKVVQQGWTKDIEVRLTAQQMRLGLLEILSKKRQQQSQTKVLTGQDHVEEYPSVSMTTSMSC
jgi:serine/threonine protein kinase